MGTRERRKIKKRRRRPKRSLSRMSLSNSILKRLVSSIIQRLKNDEYLVTTTDILNDYKLVLQY